MVERERGLFAWVGCVLLFTGVIFTVRSVTVGAWLFTCEGTESVSSDVVPVGTFNCLGCSNIGIRGSQALVGMIGSTRLAG